MSAVPPDPDGARALLARLEDRLLGGPRTLTMRQVAERAHADLAEVQLFWHALGMPATPPDAVAFTEQDVAVIADVLHARHAYDVPARTGVSLVRSAGHTADRLVLLQMEALVEHLAQRYSLDDASARLMVLDRLSDVAPLLEEQLVHAYRRQLAAVAGRFATEIATAGAAPPPPDELPLARAVGFADVVAFTTRTAALDRHGLAELVQRFESVARDVVTRTGGRVVKTIGDAVLFVADDAVTGAEVALGLSEAFAGSPTPVRVGLVWGRVLSRFGDVFGPPVNLASRLTHEAEPGTVLADGETGAVLAASGRFDVRAEPGRTVAGLGFVRPVRLSRLAAPAGAAG